MRLQQVPTTRRLRLSLLGGFSASDGDGKSIEISAKKGRAVLAVAALSPGGKCTRARLANLLWSDRGEDQARGSLRQTLALLRKELVGTASSILHSTDERVLLDPALTRIDAHEFAQLATSSNVEDLRRAVALYTGDLLHNLYIPDQAFDEWLSGERARLKHLAVEALERLTQETDGRDRIGLAERLLKLDPLREASHVAVMEAYDLAGERLQALRHYDECRHVFETELGVEPGQEIEQLRKRILREVKAPPVLTTDNTAAAGENATSIAVLPFRDLSDGGTQSLLADGLTEDLITDLSRYRHLQVVSRHSSFAFRGQQRKIEDIAKELNAEFVVEGSIRIAGQKLRVSFELADGKTGKQVVAERYERQFDDIMEVLDDLLSAILARLTFNLDAAAGIHRQHPSVSGLAYSKFLRARGVWQTGDEKGAQALLHEAIAIDPNFAQALAYLAFFYSFSTYTQSLPISLDETIRKTRDFAERAIAADPDDPFVLQRVAMALSCVGDVDLAQRYAEAAAARNPRDIEVLLTQGTVLLCRGDLARARKLIERACASEPRLPPGYWIGLAECRYLSKDYTGAVQALETIVKPSRFAQCLKAACLAQAGELTKAKEIALSAKTDFDPEGVTRRYTDVYSKTEHQEAWLEGFRLAGLAV